ncbi:MAG: hypothetical protein CMF74_08000 [Maricaulis sp.]|jgi:hypothetical protein|nr:hypothetical protein [Maricaulis sp.]HAQ34250.1 DUF962 domain-containing protein [Alphaproteobacteria bacterium]|tara:strand:+ start:248 stop:604 length:357 start_codon:yes stop_codon:yes gene_type:complete
MARLANYAEFWPHYLREHARPETRISHYIGSILAIGVLIWALVTQTWWALILVPVSGYFFAWISHAFMERNKPATFTHPLWSLISDYRMLWSAITGKLPGELRKAGVTPAEAGESPAP